MNSKKRDCIFVEESNFDIKDPSQNNGNIRNNLKWNKY